MKNLLIAALGVFVLIDGTAAADSHCNDHSKLKHVLQDGEHITVDDAWVRASAPAAKNGVAYLTLTNHSRTDDKLVEVATTVSDHVGLHTHLEKDGVMRMRKIDSVAILAKGYARLEPGGDHIMFIGLKKPLKVGDHVLLDLKFCSGMGKKLKVMVIKGGKIKKMHHNH